MFDLAERQSQALDASSRTSVQKRSIVRCIGLAASQRQHSLSRFLFGRSKFLPIQFEKQNTHDNAGALIAINEGMITDEADGIGRC